MLNLETIETLIEIPKFGYARPLKTGQHSIFAIIYLLLHIKYKFFDSLSKILFNFFMYKYQRWNILDSFKILLHNVYKPNLFLLLPMFFFFFDKFLLVVFSFLQ